MQYNVSRICRIDMVEPNEPMLIIVANSLEKEANNSVFWIQTSLKLDGIVKDVPILETEPRSYKFMPLAAKRDCKFRLLFSKAQMMYHIVSQNIQKLRRCKE